jgi:O-methyltransferase/methyltransferase family protein
MPKPSKEDLPYRTPLDEFVRGVRKGAALKAALELEIFTRIAEGHRSLPALLRVSGMNERGARLLLDALANIGLLVKSPFEYSLSPAADTFLVKGKATYHGEALLAQLAWDMRGQVARSVRSGKPAGGTAGEGGTRLMVTYAGANWTNWESAIQEFAETWDQLEMGTPANTGLRALGFGVEAGLRLLGLAERDHTTRFLVVDTPPALAPLRSIVEGLESKSQIGFMEGDWFSVVLPAESHDLVFVDSITAYRNFEQNIGILHRAFEALATGGRILLHAMMSDDDRKGPGWVPLAGLDLLLASVDGDIYTVTEYRGMLEAAGFFEVKQVGEQTGILTARRIPSPPPPPPALTIAPDFIPPPEALA